MTNPLTPRPALAERLGVSDHGGSDACDGATAHEIAAVTGHRTLAMVAHYTRAADQERLAVAGMNRKERKG